MCGSVLLISDLGPELGSLNGSGLHVKLECINGHEWSWDLQPMVDKMPIGNLLISAAILFGGQQSNDSATLLDF